ncbi:hypothetical protein [Thermococcus sp. AM4]|uniref:hypothetical protein n=1 Tax=Thermococcus sp. (strain AM4) TaxID=246969 RepID=UPI0001870DDD|nr:hypothetical protein [Thermococcus sp. AM4]EEB73346.1 conserved hypothetical protein [Thermococcus sp. AM4]
MEGEELRFTGNWFIDAGILGFVNLMEEVYGWDLEELQRRIKNEPEKVYYGYFPLAYFYNLASEHDKSVDKSVIAVATEEIENFQGDKHKLLELVWWKFITGIFKDKWIKNKLKQMHKKDVLDRNGNPKPAFNDETYLGYIETREKLLVEVACDKDCQNALKSALKLRKVPCENNTHKLELEQIEQLKNPELLEALPEKCSKKLQYALEVHANLREYLMSQWFALREIPYGSVALNELKQKSRYFRIPIDSGFYKNFMFFNNSRRIFEQLEDFRNIIEGNVQYTEYLQKIDKTLSKFLPSDSEFPNVHYTPIKVEPLLRQVPHLFIYLLNFLNAFTFVSGVGNVFFYGSTLEFTYHVNKRLKVLVAQTKEKQSMFRITWQAVIDAVIEEKAQWSLENMYLINFAGINQQNLVDVEYIGIPKLHASIILDDQIREALNTQIPIDILDKSKNKPKDKLKWSDFKKAWLLELFISRRPMFPVVLRHSKFYLSIGKKPLLTSSLYALAVDAKLKSEENPALFSQAFFDRPKRAVVEVKDFYRDMNSVAVVIRELSPEIGGRNLIYTLFSALRKHNRNAFVNTLLKALLQVKSKEKVAVINSYLFRRVLNNDSSWEDFALALIVGLVGGGGDGGSGQESVED